MSQGEKKKYVYYKCSYRVVMRTELILRELWNYKIKDDIYVTNVVSSTTAVNECTTMSGVVETVQRMRVISRWSMVMFSLGHYLNQN